MDIHHIDPAQHISQRILWRLPYWKYAYGWYKDVDRCVLPVNNRMAGSRATPSSAFSVHICIYIYISIALLKVSLKILRAGERGHGRKPDRSKIRD